MRRVAYYVILTADGMYADPDGGLGHYDPAEDEHRYANDLIREPTDEFMGRRMYEVMDYWDELDVDAPGTADVEREFAERWRATRKHVFSRGDPPLARERGAGPGRSGRGGPGVAGRGRPGHPHRLRRRPARDIRRGRPHRHLSLAGDPDRPGIRQASVRVAAPTARPAVDRHADVLVGCGPHGVRAGRPLSRAARQQPTTERLGDRHVGREDDGARRPEGRRRRTATPLGPRHTAASGARFARASSRARCGLLAQVYGPGHGGIRCRPAAAPSDQPTPRSGNGHDR